MNMSSSAPTPFALKASNADFKQRQQNVFDQLNLLENNRNNTSVSEREIETDQHTGNSKRTQRSITKHFRGKESIFKKPQNPVPKNYINRIPDFKKHPHKWTRYTLDDVKDEDISDRGNTKAALSFLKELEDRKSQEMDCDEGKVFVPTKITFKKHTLTGRTRGEVPEPETSASSFRSSKVIMPEYVVGQKAKKEKKNKIIKDGKGKELKLDHLLDNEDE